MIVSVCDFSSHSDRTRVKRVRSKFRREPNEIKEIQLGEKTIRNCGLHGYIFSHRFDYHYEDNQFPRVNANIPFPRRAAVLSVGKEVTRPHEINSLLDSLSLFVRYSSFTDVTRPFSVIPTCFFRPDNTIIKNRVQ